MGVVAKWTRGRFAVAEKERRNTMKKRLTVLLVCAALLAAPAVFAQMGPGGGTPPAGPQGPQMGPGPDPVPLLTALLALTADQQSAWAQIREQTRDTIGPLAAQVQQLHDQIAQALQGGDADPAAIGQKLIAATTLDAQIKAALEAGNTAFKALLTADQSAKLDVFNQIQSLMHATHPPGPPPSA
jgi:uncharacterized membrane protein